MLPKCFHSRGFWLFKWKIWCYSCAVQMASKIWNKAEKRERHQLHKHHAWRWYYFPGKPRVPWKYIWGFQMSSLVMVDSFSQRKHTYHYRSSSLQCAAVQKVLSVILSTFEQAYVVPSKAVSLFLETAAFITGGCLTWGFPVSCSYPQSSHFVIYLAFHGGHFMMASITLSQQCKNSHRFNNTGDP